MTELAPEMKSLLRKAIQIPSVSGEEGAFVRFVQMWGREEGFETDLWETADDDVLGHPHGSARHLSLTGRPILVLRSRGSGEGRSILFNAHSDVVAVPEAALWSVGAWSGEEMDGRIYGRGACDVKGALISALWAMTVVRRNFGSMGGDVMLELVPGEEDCVGLGTLTSILRGYSADAAVVLEPTECLPRCASRGGLRFEVTCLGRAVHGTVKWLGQDAIVTMRAVLGTLDVLEHRWNQASADALFASYSLARPITVDSVQGGGPQGMLCDRCTCCGYLELLPGDSLKEWKDRLERELREELALAGQSPDAILVRFTEEYHGHRADTNGELCRLAQRLAGIDVWAAFNSGCEAGVRANLHRTPTLVWGPGSLEQAHAIDEFVRFDQVQRVAGIFVELTREWCGFEKGKA